MLNSKSFKLKGTRIESSIVQGYWWYSAKYVSFDKSITKAYIYCFYLKLH